jgi:hypothetical protein
MPIIKQAYCHFSAPAAKVLEKLPLLEINPSNQEYTYLSRDHDGDNLGIEILHRQKIVSNLWNDEQRKFNPREIIREKLLAFNIRDGFVELPSTRAAKHFAAVMGYIGMAAYIIMPVEVNLLNWLKSSLMLHSSSRLRNVIINGVRDESFIGKFDAKTVDKRIDMNYILEHAYGLRSIKIGWFDDGMKCGVTASQNGKLECCCRDYDMLVDLFDRERRLLLQHVERPVKISVELNNENPS